MTDSKEPEYVSTTGGFRAEHVAPFIGRKAVVTITPKFPSEENSHSSMAAGIIAGAHSRSGRSPLPAPLIYFQDGFHITVDQRQAGSQLTISLIDES